MRIFEKQKGFQTITIPAQTFTTCQGCVHLGLMKTVFGHNDVKGSFHCQYPDEGGDMRFMETVDNAKYIGSGSISMNIHVPSFCPYLPNNKPKTEDNEKD